MNRHLRRGFTLVELLIVIVVIGILSAMMMLSSSEAYYSARAAAVISNMVNLKKAITAWYIENTDKVQRAENGKGAYMIRWSNSYNGDYNLAPIQELWDSRVTRGGKTQDTTSFKAELLRYLANSEAVTATNRKTSYNDKDSVFEGYIVEDSGKTYNRTSWYVGYALPEGYAGEKMKEKFAGRAKTSGLINAIGSRVSRQDLDKPYVNGTIVWMKILSLE